MRSNDRIDIAFGNILDRSFESRESVLAALHANSKTRTNIVIDFLTDKGNLTGPIAVRQIATVKKAYTAAQDRM